MAIDRRNIPGEVIDQAQREYASEEYTNKIHALYYSSYKEKPFISKDRELYTDWEEQALLFPKTSIIPLETMTRFSDGLLPGHVYILHWIANTHRKRVPSYFEYKYGINFESEKSFLIDHGYLDQDGHLTVKGMDALEAHQEVIVTHSNNQQAVSRDTQPKTKSDAPPKQSTLFSRLKSILP